MATTQRTQNPGGDEYAPYYGKYVSRVPAGDIVHTMRDQGPEWATLLRGVDAERTTVGYEPGKWSIREVLQHVCDTERIMSYRALRIARGDATPLPGFDENAFTPASSANRRSVEDLLGELAAVRAATVALFDGLPDEAWARRGTASGNPVTVRGLAWIIAGHDLHHRAILGERYLTRR